MGRGLILTLSVMLGLAGAHSVSAQDTERMQKLAAEARRFAEEGRESVGVIEFNAKEAGDIATADVAEAKKWMEGYVADWESVAATFEKGDQQAGWKARSEAQRMIQGRERWKDRIRARMEQARTAPTEQWAAREYQQAAPESIAVVAQYIEATKGVSEAWAVYAEAIKPGVTDAALNEARQKIDVALVERDVAAWRVNWARENRELQALRGKSPELDAKLDAVEKRQAEIEQLRRHRVQLEGQQDAAETARRELIGNARELAEPILQKQRDEASRN